jgi:folate-binding protein YgfZ
MTSGAAAYEEFRARGGIVDLSDRLKLVLSGADRVRYLNGQVTSNVQKLAAGAAQPACVTTAKGRLCAEIFITASLEALHLDADPLLRDTLPARLERYIISDDATLADVTDEHRLFHLLPAPAEIGAFREIAITAARVNRFGKPGLDLLLTPARAVELWPQLAAAHVVLDESLCELLRIEAGIPRWGRELGEDTLPPEAGLDRTHIDYHKGCYIGQEVISRIKSVGHVNRQLTGFVSANGAPLAAGAMLFTPSDAARAVGVLTSAAFSFALEKPIALGYLKRGTPTGELLARPAEATGAEAVVAVRDLPFLS